jgi:VanZ family protein
LKSQKKDILKTWIAAALWLIVIAIESSSLGAASNTSRILYPLFHYLFGMEISRFEYLHFFLRKGGHVFGYGLLSILFFRAWRVTLPTAGPATWAIRWTGIAVVATAIVASLDEWHQSFNPLRTGTAKDVALDTIAAIAAQILVFLWVKWFTSPRLQSRQV